MQKDKRGQFTPKLWTILSSGQYGFEGLKSDLIAGLTVAVVALPLAMALGIASGASPEKGLITSIIAGLIISLFGGSRVQIGGPTGAFVVVVYNIIAQHGYDGLLVSTLLAGIILILAGYARLGRIIKFIPWPVVTGFTTGIAFLIASTQVKDFLGLQIADVPAEFIPRWKAYLLNLDTLDGLTLIVGLSAWFLILFFQKVLPRWPSYLIALVASALAVHFFGLPVETIGSRFPNVPTGLAMPHLPSIAFEQIPVLLPSAFTIAFLAGIEALLSAMVADGMTGFRHRSNQELIGQGIANVGSVLFGGLPATGAIARTATNITAGGRTPLAGIFHSGFVLLFVLFGTDLMSFVPMCVLAAILFMVAFGMSEIHHFVQIYRLGSSDRLVLLLTFILTIFVDLTVAIAVGVTLASLFFMAHMSKAVQMSSGRRQEMDQRENLPEGVEVFWIGGPIFFGVAAEILDVLTRIGTVPKILIIRMGLVPFLDASGAAALSDLLRQCHHKGAKVIFSSVQPQPAALLSKLRRKEGTPEMEYASSYDEAIEMAEKNLEGLEASTE